MSNWPLADCVAFRVTCFPLSLDLGLAFSTLRERMGEVVNGYRSDVDELDAKLGGVINDGTVVWK
jgi:hypothetical protein